MKKLIITTILIMTLGQSSYAVGVDIMRAFIGDENLDFQCITKALRQGQSGLDLLDEFRSRISCNEKADREELCQCISKLNKMDGVDFSKEKTHKKIKEKIKEQIAASLARDLLYDDGKASLNALYKIDAGYNDENSSCKINLPEAKKGTFLEKHNKEINKDLDFYSNTFNGNIKKDPKKTREDDYQLIRELAEIIRSSNPNVHEITDVSKMSELIKDVSFNSVDPFMFMNYNSAINDGIMNDSTSDHSVVSRIMIKTFNILREEDQEGQHYNRVRNLGGGHMMSGPLLAEFENGISDSKKEAEDSIKKVMEEELKAFTKKNCDKYNEELKAITEADLNLQVEQQYTNLFHINGSKSMDEYRNDYVAMGASIFVDILGIDNYSSTTTEEYNLIGEEYMYYMNSFYCHEMKGVERVMTSFSAASAKDAVDAARKNAEIVDRMNETEGEIKVAKEKRLELENEIRESKEKAEFYENQKELYEKIRTLGVAKEGEADGAYIVGADGKRYLNMKNNEIRKLYFKYSGLSVAEIEAKREQFYKEGKNTFLLPGDEGLASKSIAAEAKKNKVLSIITKNEIAISSWNKDISKLTQRNALLQKEFDKNDAIVNTYAKDDETRAAIYSHVGANIGNKSPGGRGRVLDGINSDSDFMTADTIPTSITPTETTAQTSFGESVANSLSDFSASEASNNAPVFNNSSLATEFGTTQQSAINSNTASTEETPFDSGISSLENRIKDQQNKISSIENSGKISEEEKDKVNLASDYRAAIDELNSLKNELKKEKQKALDYKEKQRRKVAATPTPRPSFHANRGLSQASTRSGSSSGSTSSSNGDNFSGGSFGGAPSGGGSQSAVPSTSGSRQSSLTLDSSRSPASTGGSAGSGNYSMTQLGASGSYGDNRVVKVDVDFSNMTDAKKEEFFKDLFEEGETEVVIELANGEKILISNNEVVVKKEEKREVASENKNKDAPLPSRSVTKYQDLLDTLKVTEESKAAN